MNSVVVHRGFVFFLLCSVASESCDLFPRLCFINSRLNRKRKALFPEIPLPQSYDADADDNIFCYGINGIARAA